MLNYQSLEEQRETLQQKIGFRFRNYHLLLRAFCHRSYANEATDHHNLHNERLEFLGDTVLSLVISDYLYQRFPSSDEGKLTQMRAKLVEATACAQYIEYLGVGEYLLLGRGEMATARGRGSLYANLFEAIVAAIYLDSGLAATSRWMQDRLKEIFAARLNQPTKSWKSLLQDVAQRVYGSLPHYEVVEESGASHTKRYQIKVSVGENLSGEGKGSAKKQAQQEAAKDALQKVPLETLVQALGPEEAALIREKT